MTEAEQAAFMTELAKEWQPKFDALNVYMHVWINRSVLNLTPMRPFSPERAAEVTIQYGNIHVLRRSKSRNRQIISLNHDHDDFNLADPNSQDQAFQLLYEYFGGQPNA